MTWISPWFFFLNQASFFHGILDPSPRTTFSIFLPDSGAVDYPLVASVVSVYFANYYKVNSAYLDNTDHPNNLAAMVRCNLGAKNRADYYVCCYN